MTNARQQTRDEDSAAAVRVEPRIRFFETLLREVRVASVLDDDRTSHFPRDPVTRRGTDPRSRGRRDDDEPDVETSLRRPECGGRNDDFGGNRERSALENHHHEYAEVSVVEDELHPGCEEVVEHGRGILQ